MFPSPCGKFADQTDFTTGKYFLRKPGFVASRQVFFSECTAQKLFVLSRRSSIILSQSSEDDDEDEEDRAGSVAQRDIPVEKPHNQSNSLLGQ